MQYWDVFVIPGVIALFIGLVFGFILGSMEDISSNYRIGLGLIVSFFGGMISSLFFLSGNLDSSLMMIPGILACLGGCVLGAIASWVPPSAKPPRRYIIFEPDEDDEFDREIEEALGGKANNS